MFAGSYLVLGIEVNVLIVYVRQLNFGSPNSISVISLSIFYYSGMICYIVM